MSTQTQQTIKIQPAESNGVLPYPYFVQMPGGIIGRQDFWKGRPKNVLGFASAANPFSVELTLSDLAEAPDRAVGLSPIFENSDGAWVTFDGTIESVSVEVSA